MPTDANEHLTRIRLVRVTAKCDCGGNMKWGGVELTSYPPQYPHKCESCGKGETYWRTYPHNEEVADD